MSPPALSTKRRGNHRGLLERKIPLVSRVDDQLASEKPSCVRDGLIETQGLVGNYLLVRYLTYLTCLGTKFLVNLGHPGCKVRIIYSESDWCVRICIYLDFLSMYLVSKRLCLDVVHEFEPIRLKVFVILALSSSLRYLTYLPI